MANWLVLHSLKSFSEHNDLIGVTSARVFPEPIYPPFAKIAKDDHIAYYAIRDCVVVGVFKVVSQMEYLDDAQWGPSCVYSIVPTILPPSGKVLDFKHLVKDLGVHLDLIPEKRYWPAYLRGHASRPLSERDFSLISKRVSDGPGLTDTPLVRPP